MDGRRCVRFLLCFGLFGATLGCVPGQNKLLNNETKPGAVFEESEPKSANPFASEKKREPKLELAIANMTERSAQTQKDNPEQQFRRLDEARKMYQEILVYDAKNIEAHRGLGRIYVAQREYDRAVAIYQKAAEIDPKNGQLYADMSIAFSKRNDFNGAIQKLTKAREIDPDNPDFMKMLGVNLVCAGQIDRGIEILSRSRGKAAAHYYVAHLLDRKGQPEAARRHVELALEANPNFADARALLAEMNDRPARAGTTPNPPPRVGLQFTAEQ